MHLGIIGQIIKYVFLAYFTINLVRLAYTQRRWINAYRNIKWKLLGLDFIVATIVLTVSIVLSTHGPGFMTFSWLNLVGSKGTNVNVIGWNIKFFGIIYCLLLMAALPTLTEIEEEIFRKGTKSWPEGIFRSIIFGLTHTLVGINIGTAIALSIGGLFFTYEYFKGGVKLSAQAHFQYDLILIFVLLVGAVAISI